MIRRLHLISNRAIDSWLLTFILLICPIYSGILRYHTLFLVPDFFLRKLLEQAYIFFWFYFDKIKSQKRYGEMLYLTRWRPFQAVQSLHIPCNVVHNNSSDILVMPIWGSDYACFRAWYWAFYPLKWAISNVETVLIAWQKNRH